MITNYFTRLSHKPTLKTLAKIVGLAKAKMSCLLKGREMLKQLRTSEAKMTMVDK